MTQPIASWRRLAIALGLLLAGIALMPYVALPSERFGWQLFSGVYSGGPRLVIDYEIGAPGSSFTVTGFNFPANRTINIKVNGRLLGTTLSDDIGGFQVRITSDSGTEEGFYEVEAEVEDTANKRLSAVTPSAGVRFRLSASAPLRVAAGQAVAFVLPDNIALDLSFAPFVAR